MEKRIFSLLLSVVCALMVHAQSGLDARSFRKYWTVESEAPGYRLSFSGDTCEVVAPKGLTLWRKQAVKQGMAVDYDVLVTDDRLSDMNLFWMASDPAAASVFKRMNQRQGVFKNCYQLQMYYLGYGGNYNSTTRFRRYMGGGEVPPVWKEYTDAAHLLRSGHWYHWRVESTREGRTRIFVDGELLVDYLDPTPLTSGWFGFRTTLSRIRITNFRMEQLPVQSEVPLHWIGATPATPQPSTFGVPFAQGELKKVTDARQFATADCWPLAYWPDGSVKWMGVSGVFPAQKEGTLTVKDLGRQLYIANQHLQVFIPKQGDNFLDSMLVDGLKVGSGATLVATTTTGRYTAKVEHATIERQGKASAVVKVTGRHGGKDGRCWLPFTLRLYFWQGTDQVKLVHSFIYDGEQSRDFITSLGVRFGVPLRTEAYNRHIAFAVDGDSLWHEPVQPLDGRRTLSRDTNWQALQMQQERIPAPETFDGQGQTLLSEWAQWDGFRLSQLTDNAWSIRKRATDRSPWIGTLTGCRATGQAFVGDTEGGISLRLTDFWQSYPSAIQVDRARSNEAQLTMYLWSPEAEAMNLCHYDTIAHGLLSSYEDVQEGMSTPYGIGRTSELWLQPYTGKPQYDTQMGNYQLLPTPEYLHSKRAFGIWSLPTKHQEVEQRLDNYIRIFQRETERCKWYGFWNYGDVMHAYDEERHEWRYDVGGFAWDNTELASPMWLWYSFLRSGRADIWRMAIAMTRHNSEVDTYHIGPFAPLGSRHNVSHWGCGAKEARISQSAFLRFFYYLTADERTGDLMHAQTDCDTLLYHLDPMRLAEPRSLYPCQAPARLRIGPDWLAYAGNWMTEWERTGNRRYADKIKTGLQSMAALKHGLFTGNKALGYDPATGRITYEGSDSLLNTNHLCTIMGGFELMNELMPMLPSPQFESVWLDHARRYREMALKVSGNKFPVRRLDAYAAWKDRDVERRAHVWQSLLAPAKGISTNDAALWSLDAIYMLEVF
ncbi:MAG: DUF6250 domain-containing protein [Prevotella sp.]|nr:DUF6250 domain-containing protein [Prevotella sp.]